MHYNYNYNNVNIMDAKNMNQEAGNKRKSDPADEMMRSDKSPRIASGDTDESYNDDERKLEEKRAYNRRNAARARQRTKDHILELTARAERYAAKNEELQKANDALTADVARLTEENQRLRQLVKASNSTGSVAGPSNPLPSANVPTGSLPQLGTNPSGPLHPGSAMPTLGAGTGVSSSLMDQGSFHGPPGIMYFPPSGDSGADASTGANDSNAAAAAARQRGLIIQLLQQQSGQGDSRQGLPPGYNF